MIQKCEKCSCQFSRKKIIKSILFGYKPIKCDSCNAKYYVDSTTKTFVSLGITIPLFIYPGASKLFINFGSYGILICIFLITLYISLIPFFARYHIEE